MALISDPSLAEVTLQANKLFCPIPQCVRGRKALADNGVCGRTKYSWRWFWWSKKDCGGWTDQTLDSIKVMQEQYMFIVLILWGAACNFSWFSGSRCPGVSENLCESVLSGTLKTSKICPLVSYNLRCLYFTFGENQFWILQKGTVAALLLVPFILSEKLQITLFNICFICVSELILVLQQRQTCLMRIKITLNWILLWEFLSITQLRELEKTHDCNYD